MSTLSSSRARGAEAAGEDGSQGVLDLAQGLAIVRRHLWSMLAAFVVVFALVSGLLSSLPKAYTSTAQIQILIHEKNNADVLASNDAGDSALADSSKVETEVNLIQSEALAKEVMAKVGPEPVDPQRKPSAIGALAHSLRSLLPRGRPAPADPAAAQNAAVQDFLHGLKASRVGESYLVDVAYTADSPDRAALIANAFVEAYHQRKLQSTLSIADTADAYLTSSLADLERQVTAADTAVAQYKASHNLEQAGASTMSEQNISLIAQQLITAKGDDAQAQARYRTAQAQVAAGGNGGDIGDALSSSVVSALRSQRAEISQTLTDLRARYGPRHPEVIKTSQQLADIDAQIQAEIERIRSNLRAQAEISHERVASLQGSLAQANRELAGNEGASVELNDLLRKQDAARTAYQAYLTRYKQTSAQQDLPQNEMRVVNRAEPDPKPTSLNGFKATALSLIAALAAAAAALAIGEALKKGFEDSEELERRLGARALPSIPDLASTVPKRTKWPSPPDYIAQRPLSAFAETFRTLRTSIISSGSGGGSGGGSGAPVQVVAFTSALPGEGKTTTSVCFGRVSALGGARTVIMDCDLRRRSLDTLIGRRSKLGTLDVLSGQAGLDQVLIRDGVSEACLLPLGGAEDAHRNIFDTPEMDRLLAELRERFELIVLDCAPVLALADAREIARKADATVLLARWRRTPRRAVEDAVRELDDVDGHLLGVTLTQVDLTRQKASAGSTSYHRHMKHYGGYFTD